MTVLCAGVTFSHAQQLRTIECLNQSYVSVCRGPSSGAWVTSV
jgi:hypothetical protein